MCLFENIFFQSVACCLILLNLYYFNSTLLDVVSSVQFSRSVMSDCLWPHGLQHTRTPCPSPIPWVYSNSCPLDSKEIQRVHPKGNQSWIFFGRTDAEAETPILWPPDVKNWLIWEDPDAGKDWRLEEKGMTEDEMVGWYHWLNGDEFE